MPLIIDAVRARATVGEIADTLVACGDTTARGVAIRSTNVASQVRPCTGDGVDRSLWVRDSGPANFPRTCPLTSIGAPRARLRAVRAEDQRAVADSPCPVCGHRRSAGFQGAQVSCSRARASTSPTTARTARRTSAARRRGDSAKHAEGRTEGAMADRTPRGPISRARPRRRLVQRRVGEQPKELATAQATVRQQLASFDGAGQSVPAGPVSRGRRNPNDRRESSRRARARRARSAPPSRSTSRSNARAIPRSATGPRISR